MITKKTLIGLLVSRDNTTIGTRLPGSYLHDYREQGRQRCAAVMKSHMVPAAHDGGVWQKGVVKAFRAFRRHRLQMICSAFEKEAGIRLFKQD